MDSQKRTHRSSSGAAAVGRARAGAAEDVDGAAEQAEQAVAADGLLVAVVAGRRRLRVVGALRQEVDVLHRGEGGGGGGDGQDGEDVGELHFGLRGEKKA